MEAFAGLDISLHTTHICIVDAEGKPIHEGVASSDPGSVDEWLRDHSKRLTFRRLVFETGQLSTHFYHGLRSSWPVICIDARHAHGTLKAQRVKTDKNDARGLAQIARTGWYKAVHVKSPQGQALRALVGGRKQLVELRLELENHIRGTLKSFGIKLGCVTAAAFSEKARSCVADKDDLVKEVVFSTLAARDAIQDKQRQLDRRCGMTENS